MSTLERAIEIATVAHDGQVDKHGLPYILHPLRVMLAQSSLEAQIVGVLHDVLEDSSVRVNDLRHQRFSEDVLAAVWALTRKEGENYAAYIERVGSNPLARPVKIADLRDNLRADRPCPATLRPRYAKALETLGAPPPPMLRSADDNLPL